jgi:ABC-type Co2+ transport system permease subunit
MAVNRRTLIAFAVADVVIFVLSNVTINSDKSPGTASNVLWVVFLIGVLLLIVLGGVALVQSARSRRSST